MRHEKLLVQVLLALSIVPAAAQPARVDALPADAVPTTHFLHFPADRSLGTLVDLERAADDISEPIPWWFWNGWLKSPQKPLGEAQGEVVVPPGTRVGLMVKPRHAGDDLAPLAHLPPNAIELIGFDTSAASPTDLCVPALTSMKGLRTLLLEETSITNTALSSLSRIQSLERLYVLDSDLDTTGIRGISQIASLRGLRLYSTHPLTTDDYFLLSHLSAVEELILPGSPGRDGLSHLARLSQLRHLHIGGGECCESGLEELARFPALVHLSFYDLSPKGLASLPPLPNLRELDIQYKGDAYRSEHLATLAGFPQLEHLKLRARFDDEGLAYLKELKNLRSIGLHANFQDFLTIGDATLAHLSVLENLETIALYSGNYTDDGLCHLAHLPKLKVLEIPNSSTSFSDAGLVHLKKIPTLEELYLRGTNITDEGLRQLEALTSLHSLKFLLPSHATEEGIARLKSRLPRLQVFENGRPRLQK